MKNNTIRCKKLATIVSGRKKVARPFVRQKQVNTGVEIDNDFCLLAFAWQRVVLLFFTPKNCCEFLTSYGVIFLSDIQLNASFFGASLPYIWMLLSKVFLMHNLPTPEILIKFYFNILMYGFVNVGEIRRLKSNNHSYNDKFSIISSGCIHFFQFVKWSIYTLVNYKLRRNSTCKALNDSSSHNKKKKFETIRVP